MQVSISLPRDGTTDWQSTIAYVQEAERLGVTTVWSAEAWGHDGLTPLAFLAGQTSTIKLGTGILQGGTRTPALLGMTCMGMQSVSNGRFLLGFGTSGPQVIEGWHGIPFAGAVSRIRETIEIVRKVVSGERVTYQGRHYTLPLPGGEGKALRTSAQGLAHQPIYVASLGPKILRMTGELADGGLGHE
jgi:alkanesulfonate monooxygenase SsuD/methylene tetrahydromethanopterin reductase-like flavin-dependent oxidoreductase (luciferase family)